MPTPKALAISSLKHMARACLREQINLKRIRSARRTLAAEEDASYQRIKTLKARIDRELIASADLLGIPRAVDDQ